MVWECRAGSQSDMKCGDNGCYDLFLKKFSVANLSKEIPRSVLTPDDHKEFILIWNYAVAFYTEADLTNLEDRQVAIAALLCETPVITEEHDIGERKIRLVGEAVISVYPLKIISITTSKSEKRDFDVILDSLPESPVPETKYPEVHLDCGSIPPSDSDLYFAPLVLGTFGLPDPSLDLAHWIGLIVERLPRDPEVYQRVGCMFYETDAKKKRRTDLENHRKSITLV
ncbi:uncharacterized protein PAC_18041 [Phialocephala subalpina]|uniref:Uncharacterized protein n=1 Tax=Phialocephala subalpina TaxID=576137 RepID=A0A1L7XSX4_9HELO|nr:uncharacterized protein PAC_18041 [Phialocephala subalpina]